MKECTEGEYEASSSSQFGTAMAFFLIGASAGAMALTGDPRRVLLQALQFDATIACPTLVGIVGRDRSGLTITRHGQALRGDPVARDQRALHRGRASLGQREVSRW